MRKTQGIFMALLLCCLLLLNACTMPKTAKTVQKNSVAMGSLLTVTAYGQEEQAVSEAVQTVFTQISDLDSRVLSKESPSAEVFLLNEKNAGQAQQVSDTLFSALAQTQRLYAHSNGMASVLSGALTELWGVDTDVFHLPQAEAIAKALPLCSNTALLLDETAQTVCFPKSSILNLGSVGKGMACDLAVESWRAQLQQGVISGAVISVGGSIATVGTPADKNDWAVGVRNPFGEPNSYFAVLTMQEGFLSTSGTYEKQFTENGKTYHHLLDLTTGYPKETNLVSVTVQAPTGLQSDALSTLCFLLGEEASLPILKEYNAQAVFVYADYAVHVTKGLAGALSLQDSAFRVVTLP